MEKARTTESVSLETQQKLETLRKRNLAITQKISELESEHKDASLVLSELQTLDPGRRCMRMMGGVLVERTIGQMTEALQQQNSQIMTALDRLKAEADLVEEEFGRTVAQL